MEKTALITHMACFEHRPPAGHPESPERLRVVLEALNETACPDLIRIQAPLGQIEDIARVHPLARIEEIIGLEPAANARSYQLDPDTYVSAGSIEAAQRAVGAVIAGVDGLMTGAFDRAFCATRPPGHHAEAAKPMGFCIWNSAAIAALYARETYGLKRVAVVDFDVHHGNGSQELAERDPEFFYASIHQGGIYPGSGFADERAAGNLVNVPVPAATASAAWRAEVESKILPALIDFKPEILIVSAGFDGHRLDPLAGLNLETDDYRWVTERLLDVSQGKLVSTLEGGYHLQALAASVLAHVQTLQTYKTRSGGGLAGV
ncbi:histone deacetylase family protein [Aquidulcibacter paucihalophilus]|uniref:histone deacetylase family protein n=1 Tax=Aquidulcibacter paucihalophilus TaxID=1978549 RepID=UPI000A197A02|nr:histone deacetylase family protein [Aquidulcibacter paucihalophilus]